VKRLVGYVLRENTTMLELVQELGFAVASAVDDSVVEVVFDFFSDGG
jgi:hypothetical protein